MTKDDMQLILKIVDRAATLNLLMFDKVSLILDMEVANEEFNLRLGNLLNADKF